MLLYEGLNLLCTKCGRFGHANVNCYYITHQPLHPNTSSPSTSSNPETTQESEWKTIDFPKKTLPRYNIGRQQTLNREAQAAGRLGKHPGNSTISIGPSEAHTSLNNDPYKKNFANKYSELADLNESNETHMDMGTNKTTTPISDRPKIQPKADSLGDKSFKHWLSTSSNYTHSNSNNKTLPSTTPFNRHYTSENT